MKNGYNRILRIPWMKLFFILTIFYFSQFYSYIHLHHSHDNGALPVEISLHPIDVDHDHDHEDLPGNHHPEDHQHTFDKHIDWHVIRTQNSGTFRFDDKYHCSSKSFILINNNNFSCIDYKEIPYIDYDSVSSLIIRGPPLLG
jgi:hypothetical protein